MKIQYKSYQETIDFLNLCMKQHANLVKITSIGQTNEGRDIMLATISADVAYADDKPALLYTGTVHAREWIGNELAIKLIEHLTENYRIDPTILEILTHNTLYIVPCLNPDGFEFSRQHCSFWRKNRKDNQDGTFGVDLNRNFDLMFAKNKNTATNTYGGPFAFSEPETQAIRDFVLQHKNITIALDYHSQGNVFFPAHKFNHEVEIEGSDLNNLCANMNYEINKVTGRRYGIHRGKPPTNLIRGSAREYYYSKGILACVVEVGTRNIPDHMKNMSQNIAENIPAVIYALSEAINYSALAPQRVNNFTIAHVGSNTATLCWDDTESTDIYYEIYRSERNKEMCGKPNLLAITKSSSYTDEQLNSSHIYFYNIRAIDKVTRIKSPFSPEIKLKTQVSPNEFSLTLFPNKNEIGYVSENQLNKNKDHFGYNSMFIGIDNQRGVCYGVVKFDLSRLPEDLHIKTANFMLYPMNRVAAKIEKYGEWSISIIDSSDVTDLTSYWQIHHAKTIHTLGYTIVSDKMTQGIWAKWKLNETERLIIKNTIKDRQILLRIQGPSTLPLGNNSQIMQFDIGYGPFGVGIHYRPSLELIYRPAEKELTLFPATVNTISKNLILENKLSSGFDEDGEIVYGQMAFALEHLPDADLTVFNEVYLVLNNENSLNTQKDIRFTIELVEIRDVDYINIKGRQKIEYIGYEISNEQLKSQKQHYFIFDTFSKQELERLHKENSPFYFIIRATSGSKEVNSLVHWYPENHELTAKLVLKYIKKRKYPLAPATQLETQVIDNKLKLTWKNPNTENFVGCFVVRNRFRPPQSPFDGVKLYGGPDEYTFDDFGNIDIDKYYSIFTYDNVPNYSCAASIYFKAGQSITL